MKKLFIIISAFVLLIGLTACGSVSTTKASNIAYTKEFSYIPAYSAAMKADSTSSTSVKDFTQANYTLQNVTNIKVFEKYQDLLNEDGWTITNSEKPRSITAKKDAHIVTMSIMQYSDNVIKLIIMAK